MDSKKLLTYSLLALGKMRRLFRICFTSQQDSRRMRCLDSVIPNAVSYMDTRPKFLYDSAISACIYNCLACAVLSLSNDTLLILISFMV